MSGLAAYKRFLPAGASQEIGVRGTTLVLRECLAAVTVSTVENQTSGKAGGRYTLVLRRGEKIFTPQEFDQVTVHNETAVDQHVELLIGSGDYVQPPPDIASADLFVGHAPVACVGAGSMIVDENPTRKRAIIKASAANTDTIFVAGTQADAAAGNGFGLGPGEVYPGEARGQLWGASATATDTVSILEEVFNA